MTLKPWRTIIDPREDLRRGEALDAAEFAVHLDQVHARRGNAVYWQPEQFFARTYLTRNLLDFASEVVRRLAGVNASASAGFNMTTQFGGGKTHALTLLYHLARGGPAAAGWTGVRQILDRAGVAQAPEAATAVFVGVRFDAREGDGEPLRRTPWGEIAWQLGGAAGYGVMAEADHEGRAPGGDTLARLFAVVNRPILILMDEVISYVSRYRASGLGGQMYHFLHTLSEEARSHQGVVIAVAVPASELEMTTEDWGDYNRLMKLLDRLAKAELVSSEPDIAEIVRRRLFEWDDRVLDSEGRVLLPREASATCQAYGAWVQENRQLLPSWFPLDRAADAFRAAYPFHPTLLSVFERKWSSLPNFQRTRGILRLLGQWVSLAHREAYRGAQRDPLIGLGTAPLDDALFRAAVFKQMNEDRLETVIATDICGARDSHAARLDEDASSEAIRKARLHRQVATAIFFESNGGMTQAHATVPELRLAVGGPDLDIGNVETVLEALAPPDGVCFYLDVVKNRYWFSRKANLTQVLADRKAAVSGDPRLEEYVRAEIQKQFGRHEGVTTVFFPNDSSRIANQPALTVVVLPPEQTHDREATLALMERWTREYGSSARAYKSALVWAVADGSARLRDAAQKLLAWESILDDQEALQLSDEQKTQLHRNLGRAQSDLKEAVWQSYGRVYLLGKDNKLRQLDIGPSNSSAAANILTLIVRELRKYDDVAVSISPNYLVRYWPAFPEWSTKSLRDAFFASPLLPRLLDASVLHDTIALGVGAGILGYVGRGESEYRPFYFNQPLSPAVVEISDEMYVIRAETAEAYLKAQRRQRAAAASESAPSPAPAAPGLVVPLTTTTPIAEPPPSLRGADVPPVPPPLPASPLQLVWEGDIPAQKWVNFYMKVLTKLSTNAEMKLALRVEARGDRALLQQRAEEMRAALRELGLMDQVELG